MQNEKKRAGISDDSEDFFLIYILTVRCSASTARFSNRFAFKRGDREGKESSTRAL